MVTTAICWGCDEPVTTDEASESRIPGMHYECGLRSVIGSLAHLQRTCSCYGGTGHDPPEMTKREAARAAVRLFETQQRGVKHG